MVPGPLAETLLCTGADSLNPRHRGVCTHRDMHCIPAACTWAGQGAEVLMRLFKAGSADVSYHLACQLHLQTVVAERASLPDNHIKAVYLLPLGIVQGPVPDNRDFPDPGLPEGRAERAVLWVVLAQRLLNCGIEPGQLPWRLLHIV